MRRREIMAARIVGRLNARQVMNSKPPRDKDRIDIPDGGNLLLQVTRGKDGHIRRSWVFKYELAGNRHELGLGPTHTISLAEARDRARAMRQMLIDGLDPLIERRRRQQELQVERAQAVPFREVAAAYLDLHEGGWRNAKHRQQWHNTLAQYAFPKIGGMAVGTIGPADVLRCIEPIWNEKQETASRVRQRIRKILDYAADRELRTGENPAASITSLPRAQNGKGHHAAMPYAELPAFMAELRARDSISARALEFTILTAARTGEIIGAAWDELNSEERTWVISPDRMKVAREHKVPLGDRSVEILRELPRQGEKVFPLSNMAMLELLRGMRPGSGYTVHGFRSTFMDWAHERTATAKVVIDMSLAHAVGDKVEAAYRRGDLVEKRRKLMEAWAKFCASKPASITDKVVPITARG